jgi:hypothetical protein
MPSTFKTNPENLNDLLTKCHHGKIQLPDFQRSWVWDIERITSLLASISKGFPVGALMALESGGNVAFHPRPIEGSPASNETVLPQELLLDGQQRMTSLYQATIRAKVVDTKTVRNKKVSRWFYFDMEKALDTTVPREESIIMVREDRTIRSQFDQIIELDLSTQEREFEILHFPMTKVFDSLDWFLDFNTYWSGREGGAEKAQVFKAFNEEVLKNFTEFDVPVITLDKETTKEAVCIVFEKVNTGGKPLDAFELITAIYAADGYQLRKDWYGGDGEEGIYDRLKVACRPGDAKVGILSGVEPTDFLHVISLFHTREMRQKAEALGKAGKELPQVSGTKEALLNLPLDGYRKWKDQAIDGFERAAKFLYQMNIFRAYDLPYQSQVVPLAAILGDMGNLAEPVAKRARLAQWYWNGVFGELYGSSTETRVAKDFMEVRPWLDGSPSLPSTVFDGQFRADRLWSMRMRLSAAYKGANALLMLEGCKDWRTGQKFSDTVFFDESVDIHHVFPQKWCKAQGIPRETYDSIINKTPLSKRTNQIIGGDAPSKYLEKLETGSERDTPVSPADLSAFLKSHLVAEGLMRADDFDGFVKNRQARLIALIEAATGKPVSSEQVGDEVGEEDEEELEG